MYSLLLLQEALRLQARTVYRTVTGSSSVTGAHLVRRLAGKTKYSCVAQLAEHPTVNRTVAGSSPAAGAHLKPLGNQGVSSYLDYVQSSDLRLGSQYLNHLAEL